MLDLKSLVRELADSLQAIYEPAGAGFTIEVPIAGDRYQSVTLVAAKGAVKLRTLVGDLDGASKSVIEKWRKKAKGLSLTLEAKDDDREVAIVEASVPEGDATRARLEQLVTEIANVGDAIERELTGGDVD